MSELIILITQRKQTDILSRMEVQAAEGPKRRDNRQTGCSAMIYCKNVLTGKELEGG